jgi:hypothetical protein
MTPETVTALVCIADFMFFAWAHSTTWFAWLIAPLGTPNRTRSA